MSVRPPLLGDIPAAYDRSFFARLTSELRSYFDRANAPHDLRASTLNIDTGTLPTQAALATLATGDVYVDTAAGNVLKIKL